MSGYFSELLFSSGFLFDRTRDYNLPFIVTGLVQLVGGLIGLVAFFMTRCCRRRGAVV